jgi:hypothetical protein
MFVSCVIKRVFVFSGLLALAGCSTGNENLEISSKGSTSTTALIAVEGGRPVGGSCLMQPASYQYRRSTNGEIEKSATFRVLVGTNNTPVLKAHTASVRGEAAIFAVTRGLQVNTDGSPRSYHPLDPAGETFALNNICNASINVFSGPSGDGRRAMRCNWNEPAASPTFAVFNRVRAAGWSSSLQERVDFDADIIPTHTSAGIEKPCISASGFFVSATALQVASATRRGRDAGDAPPGFYRGQLRHRCPEGRCGHRA